MPGHKEKRVFLVLENFIERKENVLRGEEEVFGKDCVRAVRGGEIEVGVPFAVVCAANHHGDERTRLAAVLRFRAGNGEGAGMRRIVRSFVEVLLQEDGKAVRFKQLARGFSRVAGAESQRFQSQRRGGFAARGGQGQRVRQRAGRA